jgi:hypothetical protein
MSFDPTNRHPRYTAFASSWRTMRRCYDGEDDVKAAGEEYLPMKSGTRKIKDLKVRQQAYDDYQFRAEFPELVAPTVRGALGTILDTAAVIELPQGLEPLRERATIDGLTLDQLHRRVATELLITGRYGLIPGIRNGAPYLAGYRAEAITNWEDVDGDLDFLILDEKACRLDRETGKWSDVEQYRECAIINGAYVSRIWTKAKDGTWESGAYEPALKRPVNGRAAALDAIPFVFIGCNDLTPAPDDVPLYGLAKIALKIYRLDADYQNGLHMTAEPTPVVSGYENPKTSLENGEVPNGIGAGVIWVLKPGGDAKFLEFSGPGLAAQASAIQSALDRAVSLGAHLLAGTQQRSVESGEALKLRLGAKVTTLKTIAMASAAGLERALKHAASWVGENEDAVKVTPNLDFFDRILSAQEITAIVAGWQASAYSWESAFWRLQKGGAVPPDRTPEEERELIDQDSIGPETDAEAAAAIVPAQNGTGPSPGMTQ